jgi:hypothetical protein
MVYEFTGEDPSLEGARGMAGAVYLLLLVVSSHPCGTPGLGNGYAPDGNCILPVVLVRVEAGDSVVGEKYESPPRVLGEPGTPWVWRLNGAGGGGRGNRGGGARAMPASEALLSFVAERARRLV